MSEENSPGRGSTLSLEVIGFSIFLLLFVHRVCGLCADGTSVGFFGVRHPWAWIQATCELRGLGKSASVFHLLNGDCTFSAGFWRSRETWPVVFLVQDLVRSKCQKTVVPAGIRGRSSLPASGSPFSYPAPPGNVTQAPLMASQMTTRVLVAAVYTLLLLLSGQRMACVSKAPCPCPATSRIWCPTSGHQWDATYSDPAAAPD